VTFSETFGAMGKIVDDFLNWHLNLPWFVLIPVIIIYAIGIWALNNYVINRK
jgi:hypothetical protein